MTGHRLNPKLEQMRFMAHLDPKSKKLLHKIEKGVRREYKTTA